MTIPRIFVHIASYRDRECQWTVRDLFAKADRPERIFVGICWQTVPEEDRDCFLVETRPEQTRCRHFHIREARGLGWARQHARSLWRAEEYSLQIDSHMRFVPGWDERLLALLGACDAPDPVLTIYPPGYTPPDHRHERSRPHVQYIKGFLPSGILEFGIQPVPDGIVADHPLPTAACAGGFIFGSSRILRDVPFDAAIYFSGEEPSLALRLWTHGFDLYSPHETVVYHYYGRTDGWRHWNDSRQGHRLQARTLRRMKALCEPSAAAPEEVAALGEFGLGTQRSLTEYEDFSGVNFGGRTIADYARTFPFVKTGGGQHERPLDAELVRAPGLELFILDDEGVLFSPTTGEFYRLNPAGTFVWCALEGGLAWPTIGFELAKWRGISAPAAQRELTRLVLHWLGQGIIRRGGGATQPRVAKPTPTIRALSLPPRFDPAFFDFRTHAYYLLGITVQVRYGDRELEARIHPVLAHLAAALGPPGLHTITIARILRYHYVFSGHHFIHMSQDPATLAPQVIRAVLEYASGQRNHLLHLHAGAVMRHGCLVLLLAHSGSGNGSNTALTARLVAAGCEYFTDEVVLLERGTGQVYPAPLGWRVGEREIELLERYFPAITALAVHELPDGLKVRYLAPPLPSLPRYDQAAIPGLLVFPRHVEGAPLSVRRVSRAQAFARLLDECVAVPEPLDIADAAVLMEIMEGSCCYEMVGGDLDAAAEHILDLCDHH